ncbi:MAG: glycosyltransferase family 4 protein [Cyanobacteriota bacterium]|nr:glycosyltransferase family 4 protein [Cyanobacteriota bacterium]
MILLITYDIRRRGGIERLSLQVRDALRQSGYPCRLLATRRLGPSPMGRLAGQIWFLLQLAWWLPRSDLVFSMHALLLRPIRRLGQIPGMRPSRQRLLCWLHGIEVWGVNLPPLLQDLRACDGLAASSSFTRDQVRALSGQRPPITVIHPWADAPEEGPEPPPPLPRLLTVARMVRQERYKGHDLILDALALVRRRTGLPPSLRWRVVGDGDDRPRLQARANDLGLQGHIDWLGSLEDGALREEYRACSLVVMPSAFGLRPDGSAQGEGFGITYLEAALAGRASIAADQGGQRDLIVDGQTGWLLPPSAEALADLLQRLREDPALVRVCGERALEQARRLFSPELQRRRLARFVEPALAGGDATADQWQVSDAPRAD